MSRKTRIRRRQRRRRQQERARQRAEAMRAQQDSSTPSSRRGGERWRSLRARGGITLGFRGTGTVVAMDFETAPESAPLTEALARSLLPVIDDC